MRPRLLESRRDDVAVLSAYWPLFGLAIRTPRVELRYPNDTDLGVAAALTAEPIHDPDEMPFSVPWTRQSSPEIEPSSLRFWWSRRASLGPEDWSLMLAVFEAGELVGMQDLMAK